MKTLIVYATNTGTTEKAARKINERLKDKADIVNLKDNKMPDIRDYDFIAIGGSVSMGRIQRSVKRFIIKNREALKKKQMGLFIACGEKESLEEYFKTILEDLRGSAVFAVSIGYAYYLEKLNPITRRIITSLAHVTKTTEAFDEKEIKRVADIINKK